MKNNSINISTVLLILFIILKLTNNIDWHWLWVLSPIWLPIAFVVGIILIILIVLFALVLAKMDVKFYKSGMVIRKSKKRINS
jgi:hypothetical protein